MRLLSYSAAVTVATVAGAWVVNLMQVVLLNSGRVSLAEAASSSVGIAMWAAFLTLPAIVLYGALIAGVMALIHRRRWWAGFGTGLLASSSFGIVLLLLDGLITSSGSAEELEQASVIRLVGTLISILWSAVVAAVLVPMAPAWTPRGSAPGRSSGAPQDANRPGSTRT
ncbi:MAG: hypothetical protein H7288_24250 [Kineosporiaceae bacterium]|nr:hypothetical protein [Aeromicrobium sp.]